MAGAGRPATAQKAVPGKFSSAGQAAKGNAASGAAVEALNK